MCPKTALPPSSTTLKRITFLFLCYYKTNFYENVALYPC